LAGRVRQVADSYLAAYFERHPDEATLDGVAGGPDDRLPDDSPLALAAWQAREDAWLAELRAIDPAPFGGRPEAVAYGALRDALRSEEHTSELQSHLNLVCRLLLEKKNKNNNTLAYLFYFSPEFNLLDGVCS